MSAFAPKKRNPELDLPNISGRRAKQLPTHSEAKFSQMTHNGRVDRIMHFSPVHEPFLIYFCVIPDLSYVGSRRVGAILPPNIKEELVPPPPPVRQFPSTPVPPVVRTPPAPLESKDGLNEDTKTVAAEEMDDAEKAPAVVEDTSAAKEEQPATEEKKDEEVADAKEDAAEKEDTNEAPKKTEEKADDAEKDNESDKEDEKEEEVKEKKDPNTPRADGCILVRYFHYYKYVPLTPYIMHQIIRHHVLSKRIVVSAPKPKVVFPMLVPKQAKEAMNISSCSWWFQSEGMVVVKEDRWEPADVSDGSELAERQQSDKPYCLSLRDDSVTKPKHPVTNLFMARFDPLWVASIVPELFLKAIVQVDSKIQANVIMNRLLNTIVELRDFDYDYYYGKGDSVRQDDFRVGMVPEVGRGTPDEVRTRIVQRYKVLLRDSVSRMPELAVPHNTPGSLNILARLPSIWMGPPDLHADAKPRMMEGNDVVRGPVLGLPLAIGPIFTRVATPLYPSVGPFNPLTVHSTRADIGPPCNTSMTVKNRATFLRKYKERDQPTVSTYVSPHAFVGVNFLLGVEIAKFDHWVVKNICGSERKGFMNGNKRLRSEADRRIEEAELEAKLKLWPAKMEDLEPLYCPERRMWQHETLQDIHRRHHACVQLIGIAQDQIASHEKRFKGYVTFDAASFTRGKSMLPMGGGNITNMHLLGGSRKENREGKPEPAFAIDPAEIASVDAHWEKQASYHPQNRMVIDLSGFAVDVTGQEFKSLRKKWLRLSHRYHDDLKMHLPIICVGGVPLVPLAHPMQQGASSVAPSSLTSPISRVAVAEILEDVGATAPVPPNRPQTEAPQPQITSVSPTPPPAPVVSQPQAATSSQPSAPEGRPPSTPQSAPTPTTSQKAEEKVAAAPASTTSAEPRSATKVSSSRGKDRDSRRKHRRGKHNESSSSDVSDHDGPPPPPPPNRPPPTKWRKYIDAKTKEPYFVLMGYRDIPGPPNRHGESGQGAPSTIVQTERVVLDTVWERPQDYESD